MKRMPTIRPATPDLPMLAYYVLGGGNQSIPQLERACPKCGNDERHHMTEDAYRCGACWSIVVESVSDMRADVVAESAYEEPFQDRLS